MRSKQMKGASASSHLTAIDYEENVFLRGDISKIGLTIIANPTSSSTLYLTGSLLKNFELLGNGSTPLYKVTPFGATLGNAPNIHKSENGNVAMNEQMVTTTITQAMFMFNCSRIRATWKTMTLKVQTYTFLEQGATATAGGHSIKITVFYAFVPYSIRLLFKVMPTSTSHNVPIPNSEGVLMGVGVKNTTAAYITAIKLEDPNGVIVLDGEPDNITNYMQGQDKQTSVGDASTYFYQDVPDVAIATDTTLDVTLGTTDVLHVAFWFKSAIQSIVNPDVDYRTLAYGGAKVSDVQVNSIKSMSEQIAWIRSKPYATLLKGEGKTIQTRDDLDDRA